MPRAHQVHAHTRARPRHRSPLAETSSSLVTLIPGDGGGASEAFVAVTPPGPLYIDAWLWRSVCPARYFYDDFPRLST